MNEENTVNFAEYAKKFGKAPNANKSGIRAELSRRSFPNEWKSICLKILLHLKEQERQELGYRRRGWGDLRDRIMAIEDAQHPEGFDPRLTRQHLEHWEKGNVLADERFRFVDRFITLLDHPDNKVPATEKVIEDRDRYFAHVISDIYQVRRYDVDTVQLIKWIGDHGLLSTKIANSWFQYVAIKFGIEEAGVLKAVVAYCAFDVHDPDDYSPKRIVFSEVFIVPTSDFELEEEKLATRLGLGFQVFGRRCMMFQYRPQYQGEALRGYAAGEWEFVFSNFATGSEKYTMNIFLDHPATSISPSIVMSQTKNKYLNRVDPIMEDYLEGIEFNEDGSAKWSKDHYAGERHRYKFRMLPQQSENFDKIFNTIYRGFLF